MMRYRPVKKPAPMPENPYHRIAIKFRHYQL